MVCRECGKYNRHWTIFKREMGNNIVLERTTMVCYQIIWHQRYGKYIASSVNVKKIKIKTTTKPKNDTKIDNKLSLDVHHCKTTKHK